MLTRTAWMLLSAALALPIAGFADGGRGHFDRGGHRGYAPDHRWSGPDFSHRGRGFDRDRFGDRRAIVERRIRVVPGRYTARPYYPYTYPNRYSHRYYSPNRYDDRYRGYPAYRYDYRPSVIINLPPIVIP